MKLVLPLVFCVASLLGQAQSLYFPPLVTDNWDTISPASLGWCEENVDEFYDYLDDSNTKAFILLKDGKIVLEKYFGTFSQDSIWYWASAGKTLTAFTVGMAQEEGFLSISDTTSDYLGNGWTACTPSQEEKITIRHQLTMTSGMNDLVSNPDCTLPSCLQYVSDAGTRWSYHNAPYTLLREVVESATNLALNAYVNTRIKQPTGMDGLYLMVGDNNLYLSTARSMARFGLLIQNNGNWDGNQIMTDQNYFNEMITPSQALNQSYGYLWWLNGQPSFMVPTLQTVFPYSLLPNAPADIVAALGKNGQMINVSNNEGLVMVRMGNAPDTNFVPFLFNDSIWIKLNNVICNGTNSVSKLSNPEFTLYPNPTEKIFTISSPFLIRKLKIVNLYGEIVLNQSHSSHDINIESDLPQGIYLVTIFGDNNSSTQKLVIN